MRFILLDGQRIIVRKSGTGSSGITIRIYFEKYEDKKNSLELETTEALKDIINLGLELTNIEYITGR